MVVQHNLLAMNSNRMLGLSTSSKAKSSEKLSSGYRINRAADDAAGLAISEKMRRQIRGLTQASANCQDGVSLCQIADGALNEVQDILKRCSELAIKAANDTNTEEDREYIQMELDQLSDEIDRVHTSTEFNNQSIFSENGISPAFIKNNSITVNSDGSYSVSMPSGMTVTLSLVDVDGNRVGTPEEIKETGNANSSDIANSELAKFSQKAAANAVSLIASKYPSLFANASTDGIQVGLQLNTIDGQGGTLATANLKISASTSNSVMSYSMRIDTSDYGVSDFESYTDDQKADLAAVIAHEMTHIITYDTVSRSLYNSGQSWLDDSVSLNMTHWLIEGIAQASSGHNGWLTLDSSSTDDEIKSYMSTLKDVIGHNDSAVGTYGAGYVATMYLGMLASGESDLTNVNSAKIANGLDTFMTTLSSGKKLDEAIALHTPYADATSLIDGFRSADENSLKFTKALINAIGNNGAGSILYGLNTPESVAFAPANLTRNYGSYEINTDNQWYSNAFGTDYVFPDNTVSGGEGFTIQAGSEPGQTIHIDQYNISAKALFGDQRMLVTGAYMSTSGEPGSFSDLESTQTNADSAARANTVEIIKEADRRISMVRSYYGAMQNRLDHTIKNLDNVIENTTSAESLIRDTDMAAEMVKYSNFNILVQAGQSILAQSNQSNSSILNLLQ